MMCTRMPLTALLIPVVIPFEMKHLDCVRAYSISTFTTSSKISADGNSAVVQFFIARPYNTIDA